MYIYICTEREREREREREADRQTHTLTLLRHTKERSSIIVSSRDKTVPQIAEVDINDIVAPNECELP